MNARWAGAWLGAVVLAVGLIVAFRPIDFLVRHLKDDAFYGWLTARNIAIGLGSTFDGINVTNGYHPLWVWSLVPVYWVLPDSPIGALRVAMVMMAAYHTVTALALYAIIARLHGWAVGILVAGAWALSPVVLRISFNGVESSLYALGLAAVILVVTLGFKDERGSWRVERRRPLAVAGLGVLLGLCVLARLDAVFVVAGLVLALGLRPRAWRNPGAHVITLATLALPIVVLVGGYLLWNVVAFGHLMPVSGLVKRPRHYELEELVRTLLWPLGPVVARVGRAGLVAIVAGIIVVPGLVGGAVAARPAWRSALLTTLRRYDWLLLGAVPLYAYNSLSTARYSNWYYIPVMLAVLMVGTDALAAVFRAAGRVRLRTPAYAGAALLVALAHAGLATVEFHPRKNELAAETLRGAAWIRETFPPDAVGAAWNAGILAYFSGRRIVNVDGLINSYEFLRAIEERREPEFLLRANVAYVVDIFGVPRGGRVDAAALLEPLGRGHWVPYLQPYHSRTFEVESMGISAWYRDYSRAPWVFSVWRLTSPSREAGRRS